MEIDRDAHGCSKSDAGTRHGARSADSTDAHITAVSKPVPVNAATPVTVRVEPDRRGVWKVELPDRRKPLSCATLDEACAVAHRCATGLNPCEIIVFDAYHRVLQRERPS
jgi:hypothetical protein